MGAFSNTEGRLLGGRGRILGHDFAPLLLHGARFLKEAGGGRFRTREFWTPPPNNFTLGASVLEICYTENPEKTKIPWKVFFDWGPAHNPEKDFLGPIFRLCPRVWIFCYAEALG